MARSPHRSSVVLALLSVALVCQTLPATPYDSDRYGFEINPGALAVTDTPASDTDTFSIAVSSPQGWQVRVRVAPVDPTTTVHTLQQQALDRISDDPRYVIREQFEKTVAKHPSRGIEVDYDYHGTQYRIVASFIVANNLRYILQGNAKTTDYDRHSRAIQQLLQTFKILPVAASVREQHRLEGLARRCGSELSWAPRWQVAAARARRENKLVLVTARFYPGFEISDSLAAGALFDRDVVKLIEERFVPLRLDKSDDTPFRSHDVYGLGPSTFGQAILIVSANGEVLREISAASTTAVDEFLRSSLSNSPSAASGELEQAQQSFDQGDLNAAAELLRKADNVAALRLRAAVHRRQRNGPAALADLRRARALPAAPAELAIDEATILTLSGNAGRAAELLQTFIEKHPGHPRVAEAKCRLAALATAQGDSARSDQLLLSVVADHETDRWAWKAAAVLTSTARGMGLKGRLTWPEEELLRELQPPGNHRTARPARAAREAIEFLVAQQRPNGSWIYPPMAFTAEDNPPEPVGAAVSALVAWSLVPERTKPGVRPALQRALNELFANRAATAAAGEQLHFMDYWVWAKTYQLLLVTSCIEADFGPREQLIETGTELVAELAQRQRQSGGWSYYLRRDLAAAANTSEAISFVTAPVVLALLAADRAGLQVPASVMSRGVACLEAMRNDNGTFDYMGGSGIDNGSTGLGGAAGRGPLCELALHRAGRNNDAQLRRTLRIFAEHYPELAREQGKNLMHAGPDSQGSHYLLFDYAYTALALREIPAAEQPPYRKILLQLVNAARYEDGSYLDNPGMGRACGTALALVALRELRRSQL
ncbi:MAG: hypothetical protein AAF581_03025 [Planctomycetota bacterium]